MIWLKLPKIDLKQPPIFEGLRADRNHMLPPSAFVSYQAYIGSHAMRVEVVPWILIVENGVERSRLKKVPQIHGRWRMGWISKRIV